MGNACTRMRCGGARAASVAVPPADECRNFGSAELRDVVTAAFRGLMGKPDLAVHSHVSDRDYVALPRDAVAAFLAADNIDSRKYVAERYDCDDFAVSLTARVKEWHADSASSADGDGDGEKRSVAFGMVLGDLRPADKPDDTKYHAMNIFVDTEGVVCLIEPQTDRITPLADMAPTLVIWLVWL